MKSSPPLSVKIFQDTLGTPIALTDVEIGVDVFREATEAIDIKSVGERVHIPYGEEKYILTDLFTPQRFGADLGIVVTRRALLSSSDVDKNGKVLSYKNRDGTVTAGLAINYHSPRKPKVAFVMVGDIACDMSVSIATTHELGHLVNVKSYGETKKGVHCSSDPCVMNEVINKNRNNWDFCGECKPQAREHTKALAHLKAGKQISPRQLALLGLRKSL